MPDVDLDEVDLESVGVSDEAEAEPAWDEATDDTFEAMPDVEVDDAALEEVGDFEPPPMAMPDPFRTEGAEPGSAAAGGWAAEGAEDVVELNLDDLDRETEGVAGGRGMRLHATPARQVGEPLELPADAEDEEPLPEIAGAIPTDVLLSVPRKVNVEMGSVTLNGRDLLKLSYGSVVQLSQTVGDPVELVLEGRTIAEGEIVLINGRNLGVRIVALRK